MGFLYTYKQYRSIPYFCQIVNNFLYNFKHYRFCLITGRSGFCFYPNYTFLNFGPVVADFYNIITPTELAHDQLPLLHCHSERSEESRPAAQQPTAAPPSCVKTLPGWGASRPLRSSACCPRDFNPRSPGGERHAAASPNSVNSIFQSALPGWGASSNFFVSVRASYVFQSTLPGWGASSKQGILVSQFCISIHAPRVGSVRKRIVWCTRLPYFNPRSPGGERRQMRLTRGRPVADFNPRSPGGERPGRPRNGGDPAMISIHAPRVGSVGVSGKIGIPIPISIHAPRVGSVQSDGAWRIAREISIHAPRVGSVPVIR